MTIRVLGTFPIATFLQGTGTERKSDASGMREGRGEGRGRKEEKKSGKKEEFKEEGIRMKFL